MAIIFVLIKCQTGFEKVVKSSIEKMARLVDRIDIVTGEYDLIVQLRAETSGELQRMVLGKLRNIPNIIQTVSLTVIET
ncbi:MAG: hypothetical protein HeimC3_34840 [Candidatus Heimdallarchaeota archaeon LC_3]|nr:MAG: hypothetical protein HeimC3_37320 [Candidatus Heimdallarchaeota archaeon LC_3]OLS21575.1 MAG: hypothetical protein HeimC3_34840 [Candidatus Heimdallarchaeota archaeon LC_3]